MVQKTLNAIYGGCASCAPTRTPTVKLIAEIDEIPAEIAAPELDGNIMKLETDGDERAKELDAARARHGEADRHEGPRAGRRTYLDAVQARADQALRHG